MISGISCLCSEHTLTVKKKKEPPKLSWLVRWKGASLVAPDGKEVACNAGDGVQSLGWEDPLEKGMATHSSILAWRNAIDRGAWWATIHGVTKSRTRQSN